MTFFGVLLVAILGFLLVVGILASKDGVRPDGTPLPKGFNRLLFVIALLIIGVLTIGTGSLL